MTTPGDEELDEVQHKIDEARQKAVDDGIIEGAEHERRYYESGDEESEAEDDQNAAPA
jgi:hypothetical protein